MGYMTSHKGSEILTCNGQTAPFLKVCLVKQVCIAEEVLSLGACDIVSVKLTSDDTIFASRGG